MAEKVQLKKMVKYTQDPKNVPKYLLTIIAFLAFEGSVQLLTGLAAYRNKEAGSYLGDSNKYFKS